MSVKLGTDLFQPEASDEIALWLADEFTQVRTYQGYNWTSVWLTG